ncbi:M20/M25/M40 family metallo-hydrolase [Aerolutibacter daejeonensis]|uniref:M20/M25/M40 family metallo-hydrolase n=1 Tax=Aerolutibacter daejeonensis TaxID=346181 RepID=UPI0018DCC352|nr:M20/M25/M40 family metallo-hydrolase [Lysobacter daejeonensis]
MALLVLSAGCRRDHDNAATRAAQARIEADVRRLADDVMEGREAGTRGHARAAAYVAARFRQLGLIPAGDKGGYLQHVPLLRAVRRRDGAALVLHRDGSDHAFAFADEFLPAPDFNRASSTVTAPAVFVGQGVQAPETGHDDFDGLDLRGRIAVVLGGAPARLGPDARAFHGSLRRKLELLVARGAVGAVLVSTRGDEAQRPWRQIAAAWARPALRLRCTTAECGRVGGAIDGFAELRAVAAVSAQAAPRLFAGSGHDYDALLAAADAGTLRGFSLPGTMTLGTPTDIRPLASPNVVARLPGRGLRAADHIVFTAHLDHVGIGVPVHGDAVYNGALDNALGVAVMLESARELARAPTPPQRSLLFVATTAEEAGLLGADWFVRHPPVLPAALVANLNLDMPLLLAPADDVVPIGSSHSTLQATVEAAARDVGVGLSADPAPEQSMFVRSDQYPFIRAGIPAVYLAGGVEGAGWGDDPEGAADAFLRERYHRPGDDATQPIQYADAVRLARLNARIALRIAAAPERPRWNAGDFFGERFGQPVSRPGEAIATPR